SWKSHNSRFSTMKTSGASPQQSLLSPSRYQAAPRAAARLLDARLRPRADRAATEFLPPPSLGLLREESGRYSLASRSETWAAVLAPSPLPRNAPTSLAPCVGFHRAH